MAGAIMLTPAAIIAFTLQVAENRAFLVRPAWPHEFF